MSGAAVPAEVGRDEALVRLCDSGHIRGDGSVKERAFRSGSYPFEISVHRDRWCMPGCRDRRRASVSFEVRQVLEIDPPASVRSDPVPDSPDHALVQLLASIGITAKTQDEAKNHAKVFATHLQLCAALAGIAKPNPREP